MHLSATLAPSWLPSVRLLRGQLMAQSKLAFSLSLETYGSSVGAIIFMLKVY